MSEHDIGAEELTLPIKRTEGETLEERLTGNAYHNILPARYLRKDSDGDLVESQEELFERVARNVALAEAVFEARQHDVEITVRPEQIKPDHPRRDELAAEVFGAGVGVGDDVETALTPYNVNKFAYETIVPELPPEVREHVESVAEAFQESMEQLSFMPNSPTLMNAGDELQQLSACFVDSPEDDIDDIHQTAKEAAQVFQCLTAETKVHVEGKGVVSVADVEPGDEIRQRDGDTHRSQTVEATHAYQDSPVYSVETEAGIELTGTPNHELLVDGAWQRIDEIEPGDRLSVRLGWLPDTDETDELTGVASGGRWSSGRVVSNDDIRTLHAEGLSDYAIADRLDCSPSTVQRRRADELDLEPNGTGGVEPGAVSFDTTAFDRLYRAGETDGEIAEQLGVHATTVGQYRTRQSLEPNERPAKTVDQPTRFTADLAELVGMWVGDGSTHQDGIRLHLNREETLEHADRLCRRLFDEGLDWRWEDGCYDAVLHSHEAKRWWLTNFGDAKPQASEARVPEQVWRADHDTVGAFLRGLFSTDGSLQKETYPRLWTASERLLDEVQQLLLGLGIPALAWESDSQQREYYNVGPTDGLGLERYADRVGFVDSREETMERALEDTEFRGTTVGRVTESAWELPVANVERAGTATVYDVTVDGTHEYVANSVVSHNSGGGMGYAFWRLRPYGDAVGSTGGIASGPITFMRTYDQMCFPPGTHVLTPGGQHPIEELERGDIVIDENGERQPITETMERHVDEEIVEVTTERLNRTIRATGEHPFKVARNGEFVWVDADDLREDDLLVLGHAAEENDLRLDSTVALDEIASGPLVCTDGGIAVNRDYYGATKGPSPRAFTDEVGVEAFATLAGWYLAEGCVVYRRGMPSEVTFTLHNDERDAAERIQRALDSFGVSSRIETVEERNTLHVHAEHSSFAQFVDGLFGTGASEKRVPDVLWNAPVETQARVLEALFAGDGRLEKRGKSQRAKLKLANRDIVDFAFQAGLRCGVQFSRHDREPADRKPTYEVGASVSSALGTPLECLFDEVPDEFEPRDRTKQFEGRDVVAVDSVERVEYEGPVYNAEVADTHTYVADDLVVHNCETIAQGGARRGAQMGVMRVSHPDVIQFIHSKNKDVSLAETLRLNDPDDFTHTSFAEALEEARELIDEEGRVPEHLRNAVEGHLSNFNISVGITDAFMDAVKNDEEYTFTNPRTEEPHIATPETEELYEMFGMGEHVEVGEELSVPAAELWEHIVEGAHENGEPGLIYLERVNKEHSFDVEEHPDHRILATNPCGEQPLEEYEACNLGHINLSTLAAEDAPDWRLWSDRYAGEFEGLDAAVESFLADAIDWEAFDRRIELGARFLENVVTMSDFPVDEIEQTVREMRKIGLGIMGLAQLYIQLGVQYGSDPANEIARQLMTHINHESKWTSHRLAEQRGVFEEWDNSKYADPTAYREWFERQTGLDADEWADGFPMRNHNTTTIAPTGCVEERSLVSTDDGLREIADLDETTAEFEQWSEIEVGVSTDGGTKAATAIYDNGFADVRRIETEGGFSVAATPDHRFRTITEDGEYAWREADEFEPGDRILLQRNTFDGSSRAALDTTERENYYHNTDDDLRLPEEMTPDLAEFLGYFVGDGYVHDEVGVKLVVDSEAAELDGYLRDLGESVFGVTPTVEERDTRHVLVFGGRHLPRYFADNGWKKDAGNEGDGAASAFVPEEVLRGDEAVAKAFLRGLFEADGTASRKVELSTVSSTLADQVQTLLLSLGCVFVRDVLEMDRRDDHYGDRPRHTLRGANKREDKRFLDEIGFVTKSTELELTAQSHKNDTYPPAVVDALRAVDGYEDVSKPVKKRVNQSPLNGSVSRKLVGDIEEETGETVRLDGHRLADLYAAPVESVTEETAYTKDISVPSNNTYVANGFVTHNTTSMVGNTTGGCEPIYNVAYYKNVSDDVQGEEMLVEFDDYFLRVLEDNEIDVETVKQEATEQMANNEFDGVESLSTVPDSISELFVTTGDLSAKEHASVQTACQEGVDSAISKTVNAPSDSTVEDAKEVFQYIYDHGGKGVTYYRDGTRSKQVLTTRAQNTEFAEMDEAEALTFVVEQIEERFGGIEAFLEHEEIRERLAGDFDELFAEEEPASPYAEKKPRPDQLHGVTQRIETGYGKLYVTINEDPSTGEPFELFANTGHSGGFTNSFTDALAKTISVALRSGVDPYEIVDKLQGIRSPKVAWDKGEQINSIPDAFGTALRRYLDDEIDRAYPDQATLEQTAGEGPEGGEPEQEVSQGTLETSEPETDGGGTAARSAAEIESDHQSVVDAGENPECPDCGSLSLYYSEGCKTCESCGWSEC